MRQLVFLIAFWIVSVSSMAQQDPQFSLNMYNTMSINPGYAGSNNAICATALHRQQWIGFDGRPVTTALNIHGAFKPIMGGIGLSIVQDKIGFEKNVNINLAYAYRLELGDGFLGLGLSVGFLNKAIDGNWITPMDLNSGANQQTPSSTNQDELIPYGGSKIAFDCGFGAYFRTNDLYVGISSTHLNESQIKFEDRSVVPYLKRHYYLTAGYNYEMPNPIFIIKPSFFVKSDGATTQFDVNVSVVWQKMIWGGVSYRVSDAIIPMVGITLPNMPLKAAIAYDFTTSTIRNHSSGSVEVLVSYCFNLSVQSTKGSYKSVRYL